MKQFRRILLTAAIVAGSAFATDTKFTKLSSDKNISQLKFDLSEHYNVYAFNYKCGDVVIANDYVKNKFYWTGDKDAIYRKDSLNIETSNEGIAEVNIVCNGRKHFIASNDINISGAEFNLTLKKNQDTHYDKVLKVQSKRKDSSSNK